MLLVHVRNSVEAQRTGPRYTVVLAMATIGTVGLALAVLHGLEAMVWAAAYLLLGAIDTLADAVLYSMTP